MAPLSAWGERIDALLADGEWHELEELIAVGAGAVPPGKAYRRGERARAKVRSERVAPTERLVGDRSVAVASGTRDLVKQAIRSRLRRGTAEQWGTQIRRRP